jgi:hypothetical protein
VPRTAVLSQKLHEAVFSGDTQVQQFVGGGGGGNNIDVNPTWKSRSSWKEPLRASGGILW